MLVCTTTNNDPAMVYYMEFHVDGGCRGNGYFWARGAAAACMKLAYGGFRIRSRMMDQDDEPSSQRAELFALILALEWAIEKQNRLDTYPFCSVTIKSDSRYAVNCITNWIYKWQKNGWINAKGNGVANRDLIQRVVNLENQVRDGNGQVDYEWIPRTDNEMADQACRDLLDDSDDSDY